MNYLISEVQWPVSLPISAHVFIGTFDSPIIRDNHGSWFLNINHRYEALYAKVLPQSMLGETFLEKYADHHDPVTVIDPKRTYGVRAPAKHPIYENFRVKVSNCF